MATETPEQRLDEATRWKRTATFSWTNWTFGVYWGSLPSRKQIRGVDIGPLEITWKRQILQRRLRR